MIENIINQEKERIKKINIVTDHRLARDKWLNIKRVLDAIYKLISPFEKNGQLIHVNSTEFESSVFTFVLKDLLVNKITNYTGNEKDSAVQTSDSLRQYYSGLIFIKDEKLFKDYKDRVSDLYHFIEEDGKDRFPAEYLIKDSVEKKIEVAKSFKTDTKNKKKHYKKIRMFRKGYIKRGGDNVKPVIGVDNLANTVGEIINSMKGDKGSVFGVFGKWGRGKTYLITRIKEVSIVKDNFCSIDFHIWKYQDTPASWAYLYEELSKAYFSDSNWIDRQRKCIKFNIKKHGFWSFFSVIIFLILSLVWIFISYNQKISLFLFLFGFLGIAGSVTVINLFILLYKYKKTAIQLFKKYTERKDFIKYLGLQHEVQQEIKILLDVIVSERNKKVLLVIDDIDRCSEDRIIQVVDSLRIMLEDEEICRNIVVILAVDENILKRSIEYKYSRLYKNDSNDENAILDLTREYMDKLFLCGIRLGNLTNNEKEIILANYIGRSRLVSEALFGIKLRKDSMDDDYVKNRKGSELIQNNSFANNDENISDRIAKYPSINNNEIDHREEQYLKTSINKVDNITPRQIDIFQFRYLLARDILSSIKGRYDSEELCNLIAKYMINFSEFEKEVINKKEKKNTIDKVLEMVITY